jgi:hypothetical protein
MPDKHGPDGETNQPMIYQIRIKGHLGRLWADRFEELSITLEDDGTTLLTGPVVDQAALYGLLRKIRDLGITLLSVYSIGASPPDPYEVK